jgi:hypothetical protein
MSNPDLPLASADVQYTLMEYQFLAMASIRNTRIVYTKGHQYEGMVSNLGRLVPKLRCLSPNLKRLSPNLDGVMLGGEG